MKQRKRYSHRRWLGLAVRHVWLPCYLVEHLWRFDHSKEAEVNNGHLSGDLLWVKVKHTQYSRWSVRELKIEICISWVQLGRSELYLHWRQWFSKCLQIFLLNNSLRNMRSLTTTAGSKVLTLIINTFILKGLQNLGWSTVRTVITKCSTASCRVGLSTGGRVVKSDCCHITQAHLWSRHWGPPTIAKHWSLLPGWSVSLYQIPSGTCPLGGLHCIFQATFWTASLAL